MKFIALIATAAALRFDEYLADQQKAFEVFQGQDSEMDKKLDVYVGARAKQAIEHKKWDAQRASLVKEFKNYMRTTWKDTGAKHAAYMDAKKAHDEAVAELKAAHTGQQTGSTLSMDDLDHNVY